MPMAYDARRRSCWLVFFLEVGQHVSVCGVSFNGACRVFKLPLTRYVWLLARRAAKGEIQADGWKGYSAEHYPESGHSLGHVVRAPTPRLAGTNQKFRDMAPLETVLSRQQRST